MAEDPEAEKEYMAMGGKRQGVTARATNGNLSADQAMGPVRFALDTGKPAAEASADSNMDLLPVAQVISADEVVTRTLEIATPQGPLFLRDDVPTHKLLYALKLMDVVQAQGQALEADDLEAYERLGDQREKLTLQVVALIMRHSHPGLSLARVRELTSEAQREELLSYFFTARLTPYFMRQRALRQRLTNLPGDSDEASEPAAEPAE